MEAKLDQILAVLVGSPLPAIAPAPVPVPVPVVSIQTQLQQLLAVTANLTTLGEKNVALSDQILADIASLDAETTLVANNITQLASEITNSMTNDQVAAIQQAFTTLGARLTTLAVDPTQPVVPPAPANLTALRDKLAAKTPIAAKK